MKGLKTMKKILSIMMAIIVTISLSTTVFAVGKSDVTSPYQEVIDRLNAEYGLEMRILSNDEKAKISPNTGFTDYTELTVEEYEEDLRECIEKHLSANKEATEKIHAIQNNSKTTWVSVPCKTFDSEEDLLAYFGDVGTKATSTGVQKKDIAGSTAYLACTIDDSPYYRYTDIIEILTSTSSLLHTPPLFYGQSSTYSLIDARRTCAINIEGYTTTADGTYIGTATRYVEFWAGSPFI